MSARDNANTDPLFEFLLRQGDNALILSQRTAEWCGVGPALEEDIALTNIALDLLGQAQLWLASAADSENNNRSANDLAFLRDAADFRNQLLMELPNADYGRTLLRHYLHDAFQVPWLSALADSNNEQVASIAAKSLKESTYHLERSSETVIALGDGTDESNHRMQAALDFLWPYAGEMFSDDSIDNNMADLGIAPLPSTFRDRYMSDIQHTMQAAFLSIPPSGYFHQGGRNGTRHTEHLGHLLAGMQVLQRSHPGALW